MHKKRHKSVFQPGKSYVRKAGPGTARGSTPRTESFPRPRLPTLAKPLSPWSRNPSAREESHLHIICQHSTSPASRQETRRDFFLGVFSQPTVVASYSGDKISHHVPEGNSSWTCRSVQVQQACLHRHLRLLVYPPSISSLWVVGELGLCCTDGWNCGHRLFLLRNI